MIPVTAKRKPLRCCWNDESWSTPSPRTSKRCFGAFWRASRRAFRAQLAASIPQSQDALGKSRLKVPGQFRQSLRPLRAGRGLFEGQASTGRRRLLTSTRVLFSATCSKGSASCHSASKLQNHALNHRLNEEIQEVLPTRESTPIVRDVQANRYWGSRSQSDCGYQMQAQTCDLAASVIGSSTNTSKRSRQPSRAFIETCVKLRR